MILAAVFLVSLSALCYEVLLARFFSFSQWNHLSFLVISIVLFGFAASGSVLSLVERRRPGWSAALLEPAGLVQLLLLCSLAIGASFLAVKQIPLDYFRMPLQMVQALYLFLTFLILLLPFFCCGALISLAFAAEPQQSGWIYFASMLGSAGGALLPALLLPLLGEGRIVFGCSLLLLLAAFAPIALRRVRIVPLLPVAALLLSATLFPLLYGSGTLLTIRPSPYKLLPQALQFPDTAVTNSRNTIRGRVDRLQCPYLRFAPGLSLRYGGDLPAASYLVRDADALYVRFDLRDRQAADFARFLHSFAGYSLRNREAPSRVLILQAGGGLALPCAAAAASGRITLVVEHPQVASFYREEVPGLLQAGTGALRVVAENPRRYLAVDRERYDRIHLEAWGPSVPGMASLDQEHLLTVEAFRACLRRLHPEGILILSRRLVLPPSDSLKLFAAAYRALEANGARDPSAHIALIRGWDSYTLLCSPAAFDDADLGRLRQFCRGGNFDPVHYRGMEPSEANRFNSYEQAFHHREVRSLLRALEQGRADAYLRTYPLDISPARDNSPFHSRFTRLRRLGVLFRSTGSRLYSLFLSGETIVLAVLLIACLLGLFLLLLPRLALGRRPSDGLRSPPGRVPALLYFLAAGAGFMLVEMAFLQSYTFVLGNPIVAFTVVLAELLVLSGVGGALSSRCGRRLLRQLLALLVLCILILFAVLPRALPRLLAAAPLARVLGVFGLLAPIALLLGVPFPVGLRLLARSPAFRAHGWAANGVASVLASILALPLAMTRGIRFLTILAAACYVLMFVISLSNRPVEGCGQRLNSRTRNSHFSSPTENQGT